MACRGAFGQETLADLGVPAATYIRNAKILPIFQLDDTFFDFFFIILWPPCSFRFSSDYRLFLPQLHEVDGRQTELQTDTAYPLETGASPAGLDLRVGRF